MASNSKWKQAVQKRSKTKLGKFRLSFKSLRWRLTLSYSLVTVGALLIVELIVIIFLMAYFVQNIDLTPENLVSSLRTEWVPDVEEFFSQDPPNIEGLRTYLGEVQGSVIETRPLLILGNLELRMNAQDFLSFYYILEDRTLIDVFPSDLVPVGDIGKKIPFNYLPGLRNPLHAALMGIEDEYLLYEKVEPGNRIVGAIPIYRFEPLEIEELLPAAGETIMDVERTLVGVVIFTTKYFPWGFLPLGDLVLVLGRSILVFTFFAGILGSIFGLINAGGLTKRLRVVSEAAHDWSMGDFSVVVRDKSDDELGQLANDLNIMARQLENLLDQRQELSVLEERNRLARDLHDSVKQQAFAASAQLGAAKAHLENNPQKAHAHLVEAELLVGNVRQELTELIQELRPVEIKGKGLTTAVREYIDEWSRRNEIKFDIHVQGERPLPLEAEKSIFRIIQEALANISWHSQAKCVDLAFNFQADHLALSISDDGVGFVIGETRPNGMGLKSMNERAVLIGGELLIETEPGAGTKILLTYPYQSLEV